MKGEGVEAGARVFVPTIPAISLEMCNSSHPTQSLKKQQEGMAVCMISSLSLGNIFDFAPSQTYNKKRKVALLPRHLLSLIMPRISLCIGSSVGNKRQFAILPPSHIGNVPSFIF